jgi:hypothetical protein
MSYAQAMRWHKKHPRGGKPQYMGFDTAVAPKIRTEEETREFHRTKYLEYHTKNNTDPKIVLSEDDYVIASLAQQRRDLEKWNRLNR